MSKLDEKQIEKTHKSAAGQEDKAFEEWISQRVLDETAEMINGLENDPDLDDFEPSEELFQKIVGVAKERGLLAEADETAEDETEEDVVKIELSDDKNNEWDKNSLEMKKIPAHNKKISQGFFRKSNIIKCAACAAILIGVFSISMNSQANRTFVMQKIDEVFGNSNNTVVNNSGDTLQDTSTEEEDKILIGEVLDLKLPTFFYVPDDMEYTDYSIDEEAQIAYLRYGYKSDSVCLIIMANYKNAVGTFKNDKAEKVGDIKSDLSSINVELWRIEEEGDSKPTFAAKWENQNALFEMVGKFDEEDIREITQNITIE